MRIKKAQQVYQIVLVFQNDMTRTVQVKASTRRVAERRALKRNPSAMRVK